MPTAVRSFSFSKAHCCSQCLHSAPYPCRTEDVWMCKWCMIKLITNRLFVIVWCELKPAAAMDTSGKRLQEVVLSFEQHHMAHADACPYNGSPQVDCYFHNVSVKPGHVNSGSSCKAHDTLTGFRYQLALVPGTAATASRWSPKSKSSRSTIDPPPIALRAATAAKAAYSLT